MNDILFSIIMPVYNRESCVHLAIESILKQSYDSFELILVDDGSIDNTGVVCRNYSLKDKRIKYYKKENGGVSTARNYGLKHINGDYILFLDSDDSLSFNCLSILKSKICTLETIPQLVVFGTQCSNTQWKATENAESELLNKQMIFDKYLPTHINIYPQNKYFILNYIWNKCYNATFIKNNNLKFDDNRRTWEDGLFVIECLEKADNMLLISDVLHNGCIDLNVDHLSSKFYSSQVNFYIQDETKFKNKFEDLYDFCSVHYCRSNIDILNTLFFMTYKHCKQDAKNIIKNTIRFPIVLHWISNLNPVNNYEKFLKFCITKKKYHWMIIFYKLNSLKTKIRQK